MLTRARFIAGSPRLGREFLALAHQLTYVQPLTRADLASARRMRHRIEEERSKGGPLRDIKTGPGGIVDIEFAVQLAQMVHGRRACTAIAASSPQRRAPLLHNPGTLASLEALARSKHFPAVSARALREGYLFLRRVEAALARRDGKKTTAWPENPKLLAWLATRMDMASAAALVRAQERHRRGVRYAFLRVLQLLQRSLG